MLRLPPFWPMVRKMLLLAHVNTVVKSNFGIYNGQLIEKKVSLDDECMKQSSVCLCYPTYRKLVNADKGAASRYRLGLEAKIEIGHKHESEHVTKIKGKDSELHLFKIDAKNNWSKNAKLAVREKND